MTTRLYIKNMVCNRCIKVVGEELTKIGLYVKSIRLGEAEVETDRDAIPMEKIANILSKNGFELIDNTNAETIEKIKVLIINKIHHSKDETGRINFSKYLSKEIGKNYSHLSKLFSSKEGVTIEKYIIHQKIEKVKELLAYNELTLSEIAYSNGYSSVQHLSNQFKQVTGMSPSKFKKLKEPTRKPLDKIT